MQGVEFLAFGEDCTITAKVTMFGDRLTDFLNGQARFLLHSVTFESLEDGHLVSVDSVSLERSDLLVVVGTGPRGSVDQRVDLATARMELDELWLDDNPSADRIVAKMQDLDKLELQLRENEARRRLAICKLLPADLRRGFLRRHAGEGTAGPGMRKRRRCI